MATAVQIELIVDEKGAVQGIRSFDTSLRGTTGSVQGLNRELSATERSMSRIAQANQAGQQRSRAYWAEQEAGARRTAAGLDEVGKHALTSLDNVRLLRDDLGIRIPRSMEKAIASSAMLSGAIKGIGSTLLGVGALQLGFAVGKQAFDEVRSLWDNWLSATKAAEDYREEVEKLKGQDFTNVQSIETAALRIKQATDAVQEYKSLTDSVAHESWGKLLQFNPMGLAGFVADRRAANVFAKGSVEQQQNLDTLRKEKNPQLQHQATLVIME
jgi:hypothetical protein